MNTISSLNKKQGFTIVELMIVIGIFSVLSAVVLFQYGNFNSQIILTNMAYEVALATRQSQVYALGVRGQAGQDNFSNRYGMYFDLRPEPEGEKFIFFIDRGEVDNPDAANKICDGLSPGEDCFACELGDECEESYSFLRDIHIESLCLSDTNDPIDEDNTCNGDFVDAATITFERPNPDAIIYDPVNAQEYASAAIFVSNQYDDLRAVIVKTTGQISVDFLND